jgi:hypothetical protein
MILFPSPSESILHTLNEGDARQAVCQLKKLTNGQGAQVWGNIV